MPLPDFYGEIHEFPFWMSESQRSTQEKKITSSGNLYRLHKCLEGKARDDVKNSFCSLKNVDFIIQTLKINFGKDDCLIMSQMENAKECPNPIEKSVESFMHFSAIVSNMVVAMNSINCQSYFENHELIFKLEEKLPENARRACAQIKLMKEN
ncbi:hypothetical protein JTB14_035228 [Gonioctena quinquepunctata]|nr:hypothetical protein JTB14_035228 [Gonioctena quinquepunctata]